jgi:RNA polymerase sigma factor (sigma-70 family)
MIDEAILKNWFFTEIFPLDAALTRFIRRNWRNEADIPDLRQDIYARVYASASERLPLQAKPFLYITARNHLINCAKRAKIVSFEHVADLDSLGFLHDAITPDRQLTAREELHRAQEGLDRLPPRCREVVMLRKIEGLSTRETSERLGVGIDTIEQQLVHGMRALVDFMLGGSGKIRRKAAKPRVSIQREL